MKIRSNLLPGLAGAAFLLLAENAQTAPVQTTFIPAGANWRYLDNGSEPPLAWGETNFNDLAWSSGPARLGFGGDGEQTLLQGGHLTYYFRRTFTVTNAASVSNLQVRLKRDDGAIVYLNGIEIFRSNMPTGRVDSLTPAASTVGGADETNVYVSPVLTSSTLADGTNVVAAEVHQIGLNSSDVGFDLELVGDVPAPVSLTVRAPAGWSTFANNFNRGGNTLNEVLPQVADGTEIYIFNPATTSYFNSVYDEISASWTANFALSPGQGAWIHSLVPQDITITGQIPTPPIVTRPTNASLRFVSCRQPVSSTFDEVMGFAPAEGDRLLLHEGSFTGLPAQGTRVFTFWNDAWTPTPPPLLEPGRSVFADLVAPQPIIVQQPQDLTVNEGDPATFSVVVTGVRPISYQWLENAIPITGATSSTYSIMATSTDGGLTNRTVVYEQDITNRYGRTVSVGAKLVIIPAGCTTITYCPNISSSCTISNGAVVNYSPTARSSCDSTVVNLMCNPPSGTFFTAGIRMVDCNGTVAGLPVSCSFTVTVQSNCAAVVLSQPQSMSAREGDSATFTADAGGSPPLTFQWRKDGVAIPGATLSSLVLTNLTASDAGAYSFVVSNPYGSVTSADAILTVTSCAAMGPTLVILDNLTLQTNANADYPVQPGQWLGLGFRNSNNCLLASVTLSLKRDSFTCSQSVPAVYLRQGVSIPGGFIPGPSLRALPAFALTTPVNQATNCQLHFDPPVPLAAGAVYFITCETGTNTCYKMAGRGPGFPPTGYQQTGAGFVNLARYQGDWQTYVISGGNGPGVRLEAVTIRLPPVQFSIINSRLVLQWGNSASEQLQAAENPVGPWVSVSGAGSPHVVEMIGPRRFFRVVRP